MTMMSDPTPKKPSDTDIDSTVLTASDTFRATFSAEDVETGVPSTSNNGNGNVSGNGGSRANADGFTDDGRSVGGSPSSSSSPSSPSSRSRSQPRWILAGTVAILVIIALSIALASRSTAAVTDVLNNNDRSGGDGNNNENNIVETNAVDDDKESETANSSPGSALDKGENDGFAMMAWPANNDEPATNDNVNINGSDSETTDGSSEEGSDGVVSPSFEPALYDNNGSSGDYLAISIGESALLNPSFPMKEEEVVATGSLVMPAPANGNDNGNSNSNSNAVAMLTEEPTDQPTKMPTASPTDSPFKKPTEEPTMEPSKKPTTSPSVSPSKKPSSEPNKSPSASPSKKPSPEPTKQPTFAPSQQPTPAPTSEPTKQPVLKPALYQWIETGNFQTTKPTTNQPTPKPTNQPTLDVNQQPALYQSFLSGNFQTQNPAPRPTADPTNFPTPNPTNMPTNQSPTPSPTFANPYFMGDEFYTFTEDDISLEVSTGLSVRLLAKTGSKVKYANGDESEDVWHKRSDAAGIIPECPSNPTECGYVYASNSERNDGAGGVYGLYFDKNGNVLEYKPVLTGSSRNCGGGLSPWNTWISCEEYDEGQCWQVDPYTGEAEITELGGDGGRYESVAVDNRNPDFPVFFTTEDNEYGALRRFLAQGSGWDALHTEGETTFLNIKSDNTFEWTDKLDKGRESAFEWYPKTEGIQFHDGKVYFMAKGLKQMFILDLEANTYTTEQTGNKFYGEGSFGEAPDQNLFGPSRKYLYFTKDGGTKPGVYARFGTDGTYFTMFEAKDLVENDETVGIALSPDHKKFYAGIQDIGYIYEFTRDDGLRFE